MKIHEDTIAAICTGAAGALTVIRISGPNSREIAVRVWKGRPIDGPSTRKMVLGRTSIPSQEAAGIPGEPCLCVYMQAPRSYTGEDVVELQCHGGHFSPAQLLDAVLKAGARHADPGEFTKRAFLNGKLDLTQAEAVADLISAQTEQAFHLAERQLSGILGERLRSCREPLLHVLAESESRLDFPEEELNWEPADVLCNTLISVRQILHTMLDSAAYGAIIREGVRVVIAGPPNVGKSSLMNRLLGYDRAIVTDIAGTTRDTLEESLSIHGIAIRLTDTAGLRDDAGDLVEGIGIKRSKSTLKQAEIVIWMLDASNPDSYQVQIDQMRSELPNQVSSIVCWNKIDLAEKPETLDSFGGNSVRLSLRTGEGVDDLADAIVRCVWHGQNPSESEYAVSARHASLIESAAQALEEACVELRRESWELGAVCLRAAIADLGTITGETASPDVLDEIFSRFCIGK